MAIFSSYNFKLHGAQHVKDNGKLLALAINPLKADTYAATIAKVIASAAMTGADVALAANGENLQITVNGKSIDPVATALISDDLAVLIIDDINEEIILCQDATDRVVTNETGDTVTIPALITNILEATAAA